MRTENCKNKSATKEKILNFVEEKLKSGIYPTRDEIAEKFRIGLRHYFKNMRYLYDLVYVRGNVKVHPSKLSKNYFKNIIQDYIKKQILNGTYPSRKNIEKQFGIDIRSESYVKQKLTLEDFYENLGFSREFAKKAKRNSLSHSKPKSFESIKEGKERIVSFIQDEFKKGRIPTRFDIHRNFKINLTSYFRFLKDAYKLAGVPYNRPEMNILFSKERKLTKITKLIFIKKGYTIIRVAIEARNSRNRGPDLIIEDKNKNRVLVELKAYHRDNKIGEIEINQLRRYMGTLGINNGMILTTVHKIEAGTLLPDNVSIMLHNDLVNIIHDLSLDEYLIDLNWVSSSFATKSRQEFAKKIKEGITNFIRKELSEGRFPHRKRIQNKFNVHIETYFGCNSIYDLFKLLGVDLPFKFRDSKEKRDLIVEFIKKKYSREKVLPTRIEIENLFGVGLTKYFGSKTTLMKAYQAANVPVPLRFLPKEHVVDMIVQYVRDRLSNNEVVLKKDIQSKFAICPDALFRKNFMKKIIELAKDSG